MKRLSRLSLTALAAFSVTGCDAEAVLGSAERTWLWLMVPLLGFLLVGLALVYLRRTGRGGAVDPEPRRVETTVKLILMVTLVLGAVLAMSFALYNYGLGIDPLQKLWNIGLWFVGTFAGTTLALVLGLVRSGKG
jgi:hypothetical protein